MTFPPLVLLSPYFSSTPPTASGVYSDFSDDRFLAPAEEGSLFETSPFSLHVARFRRAFLPYAGNFF